MNIAHARKVITRYLSAATPVFAWGAPGIGKSDLFRQIAADNYDGKLVDFRAVLRDPVDLRGLPTIEGNTAKWLSPDDLPQEERDGKRGILLLDELNAAPPSMQAACFGLVLDRKVGNYTLPKGWVIAAAGNRQSDRAAAQRMPTALANRFAHVDIEASVTEFVEWGEENDIDPIILAFLRWKEMLLHNMEGSDLRAFPSPRSWAQAAKFIDDPVEISHDLISGCVGEGAAGELRGFIRVYRGLPSLQHILDNPNSADLVTEQSARFAVTFGLARKVDDRTIGAALAYIKRFRAREFEVSFMIDAVRRDPGLSHTAEYGRWSVDNNDVLFS